MISDILVFDLESPTFLKKEESHLYYVTRLLSDTMARIKIKDKSKNKKTEQQSTSTNDKVKENGKIYKFSPQIIGQKNEYATFAWIKEKII